MILKTNLEFDGAQSSGGNQSNHHKWPEKHFTGGYFNFLVEKKGCVNAATVCPSSEMCRISPTQTVNPVLTLGVLGQLDRCCVREGAENEQNLLPRVHIYTEIYRYTDIHKTTVLWDLFLSIFPSYPEYSKNINRLKI